MLANNARYYGEYYVQYKTCDYNCAAYVSFITSVHV